MTVVIKTNAGTAEGSAESGTLLSDLLFDNGVYFSKPCGGNGSCGKCRVRVRGNISQPTYDERRLISEADLKNGIRLACRTKVEGNCTVEMLEGALEDKESVKVPKGSVIGAAIDVGTTTVAVGYFDLVRKCGVGTVSFENPQRYFGADVLSRMNYSANGGKIRLREVLADSIKDHIGSLDKNIQKCVVVGNTAMMHMLAGFDVSSMLCYPFVPYSLFDVTLGCAYFPPCISAFAGSDLLCAVLSSGMTDSRNASILCDIGTNAEMALWDGSKLYCCSVSAGPAFEGVGISQGMTARAGAIEKVFLSGNTLGYTVVGSVSPAGICGSALIDAVSCLRSLGEIDDNGTLCEKCEIGNSGVFITPEDVRAFQLAKSAVCTGIEILSEMYCGKIESLYLAGCFGSSLNIGNCILTGLFPRSFSDKCVSVGNAALKGAQMLVSDASVEQKLRELSKKAEYIELSGTERFQNRFIKNMAL